MKPTMLDEESLGWIPYDGGSRNESTIAVERWGKDHWSVLLYLETRAVDHGGVLRNNNMRCDARRHRPFANVALGVLMDGAKHPTLLRGGVPLAAHDDWDCAYDAADQGYVRLWWTEPPEHEEMFGYAKAKVEFTPEGLALVQAVRAFLAGGGNTVNFYWPRET